MKDAFDIIQTAEEITEKPQPDEITLHTCEEARPEMAYNCTKKRHIKAREPQAKTHTLQVKVLSRKIRGAFNKNILTDEKIDLSYEPKPKRLNVTIKNLLPPASYEKIEKIELAKPYDNITVSQAGILTVSPVKLKKKQRVSNGGKYSYIDIDILINITYLPVLTESDLIESEEDGCEHLEAKCDQGLCRYGTETIIHQGERTIGGLKITRPWWEKQRTYVCSFPSKNTCAELRKKGCSQVNSQCRNWFGEMCAEYTQTFECRQTKAAIKTSKLKGQIPFCMDGSCDEHSWAPNTEFAQAASRLAILKEMQGQYAAGNTTVFKGNTEKCRKNCLGFRDCCGTGKGWGNNLGYDCSKEEKALAQKRDENRCVFVGTYCSKKVLGDCLKKKSSYCCFASRLVKLVQEQSREQLKIGWGTKESPDCRGLSISEIQIVDFSKLDLSEIFEEIRSKVNLPDANKLSQEIHQSLNAKTQNFQSNIRAVPDLPTEQQRELDEQTM